MSESLRGPWPLWGFWDSRRCAVIVTRGRTPEEASEYLTLFGACGKLTMQTALPWNMDEQYSSNHPFDWFNTPPRWIRERGW